MPGDDLRFGDIGGGGGAGGIMWLVEMMIKLVILIVVAWALIQVLLTLPLF